MLPNLIDRYPAPPPVLDASLTVVADNGSAIIVWVVPGDLEPFFMVIDLDYLPPPETAH